MGLGSFDQDETAGTGYQDARPPALLADAGEGCRSRSVLIGPGRVVAAAHQLTVAAVAAAAPFAAAARRPRRRLAAQLVLGQLLVRGLGGQDQVMYLVGALRYLLGILEHLDVEAGRHRQVVLLEDPRRVGEQRCLKASSAHAMADNLTPLVVPVDQLSEHVSSTSDRVDQRDPEPAEHRFVRALRWQRGCNPVPSSGNDRYAGAVASPARTGNWRTAGHARS